jgi:hypothetical protein
MLCALAVFFGVWFANDGRPKGPLSAAYHSLLILGGMIGLIYFTFLGRSVKGKTGRRLRSRHRRLTNPTKKTKDEELLSMLETWSRDGKMPPAACRPMPQLRR